MNTYLEARKAELLALKPNWDDEGALPISPVAIARLELLLEGLNQCDYEYSTPEIGPCPDGSVDAYFKPYGARTSSMLVNVPAEGPGEYYVEFSDGTSAKGPVFDTKRLTPSQSCGTF